MPKYSLVQEAANYCWSKNFLEPMREFYALHADKFIDRSDSDVISGEQDLQIWDLYQKYLKIYEENLSSYISTLNVSETEFYRELAEIKDDPEIKDKKLLYFVDYLIACTDYASFYKVMVRAARKIRVAEERAESKSPNKSRVEEKGTFKEGKESK